MFARKHRIKAGHGEERFLEKLVRNLTTVRKWIVLAAGAAFAKLAKDPHGCIQLPVCAARPRFLASDPKSLV